MAILGYSMAALATIELGYSMGVAPAKRGERVKSGIYKLTNHPMYVGYFVCQLGWVLVDSRNLLLVVISGFLLMARIKSEAKIL